jgi:hypothetical protein
MNITHKHLKIFVSFNKVTKNLDVLRDVYDKCVKFPYERHYTLGCMKMTKIWV